MKKLLSVLLVFAIVLSFTACGGSTGAKDALNKGLNAFKKFDTAGIEKYFVDGEISEEDLAVAGVEEAKAIFSTFSWKIKTCIEDGDEAVAEVDLTCVSLVDIATSLISDMLSGTISADITEEEALKLMKDKITDPKAKTVTQSVTITLQKVDGQWKISNPEVIIGVMATGLEGILGSEF